MIEADYKDDLALLINTPAQTESLMYNLEQTARSIDVYMNADNRVCFFNE